MFFGLSILEDSGYMARAAFVVDRFMRFLGLPGKAFVSMIVGFGCTVPAIMSTRTLESKKDRMLTIFMSPFMSCGARLPVYVLFGAAFFPGSSGMMVFSLYLTGIILSVLTGFILTKTIMKGEASHFIMELPPYHLPRFKHILIHTWNRLKLFILRAGSAIITIVIILSFLNSIGTDGSFGNEDTDKSVLSSISKKITPVFSPMGIEEENWPATVGIFTGIFAKEAVVGTLNSLYSANSSSVTEQASDETPVNTAGSADDSEEQADSTQEEENEFSLTESLKESLETIPENLSGVFGSLSDPLGLGAIDATGDEKAAAEELEADEGIFTSMRSNFSKGNMQAYAYLLFVLIYFPCVAAFGAIKRETSLKFAFGVAAYLTVLAWIVAVLFYQITTGNSAFWIIFASIACLLLITTFKFILPKFKEIEEDK
jgi:ferrous iron transport protein B